MEAEGWIQLTPTEEFSLEEEPCYYQRIGSEPDIIHSFQSNQFDLDLSNAEALTFVCHLPEVKALVETLQAQEWVGVDSDFYGTLYVCPWCGASKLNGHELDCRHRAALAPFEEIINDRRKLPTCEEPSCQDKVEALPDGGHIDHCYGHASAEERQRYQDAWDTRYIKKEAT